VVFHSVDADDAPPCRGVRTACSCILSADSTVLCYFSVMGTLMIYVIYKSVPSLM
jgi:hypothetical protein